MNEKKDILEQLRNSRGGFSVPEGYFDTVEDRVREKISNPRAENPVWAVAKPALLLSCMFVLILAIGYGTMSLTGTPSSGEAGKLAEDAAEVVMEQDFGNLEDDEIIDYLAENLSFSDIETFIAEEQTNL